MKAEVSARFDRSRKARLGQFFTPGSIAEFMASLFAPSDRRDCRLLDAGAGIGALTAAFLERGFSGGFDFGRIEGDVFEIDEELWPLLSRTVEAYTRHLGFVSNVRKGDFIDIAVSSLCGNLFDAPLPAYTHAIMNPPYRKIRSNSAHRIALRSVGIETVNLYSAFVALGVALLADHGQLVAITPRSFCNGPYYRPFREFVLERAAIKRMHLFNSRNTAFKDDDVLQENVITVFERGAQQGDVTISVSTDDSLVDIETHAYAFERIVFPDDPEKFIHLPLSPGRTAIELCSGVKHSLEGIDLNVSTGPVVDFRMKKHLLDMPGAGDVPLLYPTHFCGLNTEWPKAESKKPNAIRRNSETEKWLYPAGFYCVVRRFSAKEEKHRIVASVVRPSSFPDAEVLGFENHLNVFHDHRHGLPDTLAYGLAVFLNTTAVDESFRSFSGHTQVNVTDLKRMKYPCREALMAMGEWAMQHGDLTQSMIDEQLERLTA